jgi:hypothetical protein
MGTRLNLNQLPDNRFTTAQRDALVGVENGWIIYNTDTSKSQVYENSVWVDLTAADGGGITNAQSIVNALIFG